MTAVDTNVLVRLLIGDEPKQADAARLLFEAEAVWIAKTVLLETAWVLRSVYKFDEDAVGAGLTKLLGLRNVHAEDESAVVGALELASCGMDLADALHLTSRPPGARLVSFDRAFVKDAGVRDISSSPD